MKRIALLLTLLVSFQLIDAQSYQYTDGTKMTVVGKLLQTAAFGEAFECEEKFFVGQGKSPENISGLLKRLFFCKAGRFFSAGRKASGTAPNGGRAAAVLTAGRVCGKSERGTLALSELLAFDRLKIRFVRLCAYKVDYYEYECDSVE